MNNLKTYKFTPIADNATHPLWDKSQHKDEAIIVAEDIDRARNIATLLFGAQDIVPSMSYPNNPWEDPKMVACEEIEGSNFDTSEVGIVLPAGYSKFKNKEGK